MHDGAARGQRVSSGAGGRRDEDTIACSLRDLLFVDENLQNYSFALLPRNAHFVDTGFAQLLDDLTFGTALDLFGLDSHDFGGGERKGDFLLFAFVVEIGDFFNDLLDLFHFETAHEAEGASLE